MTQSHFQKSVLVSKQGGVQLVDQNADVLQSIYVASVLFIPIFIPTRTGESLPNSRGLH